MLISKADLYGSSAELIFGYKDDKTAGAASGKLSEMPIEKTAPVWGIVSLILLLVIIRVVWEMI